MSIPAHPTMPEGDTEAIKTAFAEVLKKARTAQGLTQEELANRAGLYRTYPSLLERAERQPTLNVVIRLGKALDIEPSEIVRRVSEAINAGDAS